MKSRNGRHRLDEDRIVVLGDTGNHYFDEDVLRLVNLAGRAAIDFDNCDYDDFPDGESKMRIRAPERIKGNHVVIFCSPIDDGLELDLRDLVFAAKQQYRAAKITVVMAFMRYRRQDREEKEHEIHRLYCFLRDLKHWGADTLIVCDPHAEATTLSYGRRIRLKILVADPTYVFADTLRPLVQTYGSSQEVLVYSPDFGSVERCFRLARMLGLPVLATPKIRQPNGEIVSVNNRDFLQQIQEAFGTDVPAFCDPNRARGMHVFMREDEVDSGNTAAKTARRLLEAGARTVHLAATHAVCSPGWRDNLFPPGKEHPFDTVWMGTTRLRDYRLSTGKRVNRIDMAPVVAHELLRVLPYEK